MNHCSVQSNSSDVLIHFSVLSTLLDETRGVVYDFVNMAGRKFPIIEL